MSHPNLSEKYVREHSAAYADPIFTRRDMLMRTGMGFGAMSLSALFGINPFADS